MAFIWERSANSVAKGDFSMRAKRFCAVVAAFLAVILILLAIAYWRDPDEVRYRLAEAKRHVNLWLHRSTRSFTRHVKGPWNPFSKKTSVYGAPFAAVRWRDSVPEVQVKGVWYELLTLNDVPVEEIVSFCKETYGRIWRKRFEEDLTNALDKMEIWEHFGSEDGTGSLTVRRLDTGETIVVTKVAWTWDNRMAILGKALKMQKANGGKDPRDDPS
jgi:hypothetical protein